jgi:hypothetical protein
MVPVNEANLKTFKLIETDGIIPSEKQRDQTRLEYALANGQRTHVPALSEFSQPFRSYLSAVSTELNDIAKRTILALRWRLNGPGSHQPFSWRGFFWSWSGEFWHLAPPDISVEVRTFPPIEILEATAIEIADIVRTGSSEPLYHALLREAWTERRANPRSAIVVGIAAAELAVKHCISTLVPDSQWLAFNLPMPPINRILIEYLPKLPAKQTFNGTVKPPPEQMLKSLKQGITIRNGIAHAGATAPDSVVVDEILTTVADVLWLVDYYCGAAWAAEWLSQSVRDELKS